MAILNALSSQFVTVQMAGASIGMGKNYKHGAEMVAADTGGSAERQMRLLDRDIAHWVKTHNLT